MTSTYWTHSYFKQSNWKIRITRLRLPTCPSTPRTLLPAHPLIRAICDITVVVKKVAQNPAVLASYYRYRVHKKFRVIIFRGISKN